MVDMNDGYDGYESNTSTPNDTFSACNHVSGTTSNALWYSTITFSVLILVGLSITVQRKKFLKEILWGVPGIVVPVNLLASSPHRYITMLVFAIMSGDILKFFFDHDNFVIFPDVDCCYAQAFFKAVVSPLLLISYLSIKFFPLLACLGVVIPVLGPALGFLYSILLFAYNTYNDVLEIYCRIPAEYSEMLAISFAARVPIYIAMVIVSLWFFVELLSSLKTVCTKGYLRARILKGREIAGDDYYFRCVRHLFKRPSPSESLAVKRDTTTYKVVSALFPFWLSPHRLPLKFLCAMIVTFFMIYEFGLLFSSVFLKLLILAVSCVKDNKQEFVNWLEKVGFDGDSGQIYQIILELVQGFAVIIPGSPVLAMILAFLLLFHLYITVHKDIVKTARGKYQYMKLWPTLQLSYSWRYPGYQIAFAFTAFIIYTLWITILGLTGQALYFLFKYYTKDALCISAYVAIPILWVTVVIVMQMVMGKVVFIEDSRGKFMSLTNQRLLHWLSYFLFIYDAINGLVSAVLRAIVTQLVGLLLMIRLDRVVLMKGFEWLDIGHKAYIGFLQLNHAYNNPVVHTFVRLLSESTSHYHAPLSTPADMGSLRLLDHCEFKGYGGGGGGPSKKRTQFGPTRARNRWLVAYTLIRNPSLRPLTASLLRNPSLLSLTATGGNRLQANSDPV